MLCRAGIALLLVIACTASDSPSTSIAPGSRHQPQTCRSGTVNYITQTLPQQCLPHGPTTVASTSSSLNTTVVHSTHNASIPPSTSHDALKAAPSAPTSPTSTADAAHISSPASPTHLSSTTEPNLAGASSSSSAISTSAAASPISSDPAHKADTLDSDSALDDSQFLSFEDWKRQNLEKAGQNPDHLKQTKSAASAQDRQRIGAATGLDALSDDGEIAIDFGGFDGQRPSSDNLEAPLSAGQGTQHAPSSSSKPDSPARLRNKDAGKTCKERFNYASFDCAANILKTNAKCKSATSVLVENKDSYMLNKCSIDNKFLIVELCDAILVDTVVLANFEFFSSMFRAFRVSVSDRYPVKPDKWKILGTYEARNTREIQAFLVENPMIYARYLRVEFISHYGAEYYCPLSLLRVHGTTMMEEYRRELAIADGELEEEDDETVVVTIVDPGSKEVVAANQRSSATEPIPVVKPSPPSAVGEQPEVDEDRQASSTVVVEVKPTQDPAATDEICIVEWRQPGDQVFQLGFGNVCKATDQPRTEGTSGRASTVASIMHVQGASRNATPSACGTVSPEVSAKSMIEDTPSSAAGSSSNLHSAASQSQSRSSVSATPMLPSSTSKLDRASASVASAATSNPTPATQESFFKSIHKRLQALESNSTLSLQYIESQSQLLRQAFEKVEKRNIQKASAFLDTLNHTVLAELSRFKQEYEQLWQSTVIELAHQRDEGRVERELLGERIRMLAEEMVSQKRLMAAQATLLLLGLGFLVFGKYGAGSSVDFALTQGVQGLVDRSIRSKSHVRGASKWRFDSPWGSPPRTALSSGSGGDDDLRAMPTEAARDRVVVEVPLDGAASGSEDSSENGDDHNEAQGDELDAVFYDGDPGVNLPGGSLSMLGKTQSAPTTPQ